MLVIAQHHISNPEAFWSAAKEVLKSLPSNLKVHGIYPSKDAKMGTCLWEAENVQDVQEFLDEQAGAFSKNYCYELNVEGAVGMPQIPLAEERLN